LTDRQPDEVEDVDEVANITVKSLWRTVPAAVPGIAFLSGGQSPELASARLNAMNLRFKSQLPWALAFSFARAIQQPALEIWQGKEANVKAAQQALLHRARCNRAARRGEYTAAMEKKQGALISVSIPDIATIRAERENRHQLQELQDRQKEIQRAKEEIDSLNERIPLPTGTNTQAK
jgi:hypothetical protein